MNKIITANSLGLSIELKESIKRIVDQLEKNNYAITNNFVAKGIFSRFIPMEYKNNGIVFVEGTLIAISPMYHIERCGEYSFRIRPK